MSLLSPGVEIKESSLTSTATSGASGRGGMVGQFQWGPAFSITQVTDEGTLIDRFGYPDNNTASSFFTASNFLQYGNDLRVVRAVDADTAQNSSTVGGTLGLSIDAPGSGYIATSVVTKNPTVEGAGVNVAGTVVTFPSDGSYPAGVEGTFLTVLYDSTDLVVDEDGNPVIGYITVDGIGGITGAYVPGDAINKMVADGTASYSDFTVQFSGAAGTGSTIAISTPNATSSIYFSDEDGGYDAMRDTGATSLLAVSADYVQPTIAAIYPGSYGDTITVDVINYADWNATNSATSVEKFPGGGWSSIQFRQQIDNGPQTADQYGIVVKLGSSILETHVVSTNPADVDIYSASIYMDTYFANGNSNYIFASAANFLNRSGSYKLGGGVDNLITASEFVEGWDYFADPDVIYVNLLMSGGSAALGTSDHTIVCNDLMSLAAGRADTLAIIDPPIDMLVNKSNDVAVANLVEWRTGVDADGNAVTDAINFNTSFATIAGNVKFQYDRFNDIKRWVPFSGDVAGLCVYTDQVGNSWDSPAGFNRGQIYNVSRVAFDTKQAQRDSLYEAQINPIVSFSGRGTVLYGDKTAISAPTPFSRINVRRLFNLVEKAIGDSAQYKLFENNDAFTRASWKSETDSYLGNIKSLGGVINFRTICDETNNTAQVIDSNQFVGTVYIQPPRSINFITLNFVATDSGINLDELV